MYILRLVGIALIAVCSTTVLAEGKNIAVFIDGTKDDATAVGLTEEELIESGDRVTNVLKTYLLSGGKFGFDHEQDNPMQITFYFPGVGADSNRYDRLTSFGNKFQARMNAKWASDDPAFIREEASRAIKNKYVSEDRLFIFGFSRGAAIARQLAKEITDDDIPVHFLGVWDTVAMFDGGQGIGKGLPSQEDVFEPGGEMSKGIRQAWHLVAIDDPRRLFQPTLMGINNKNAKEIWFRGTHSDVGGGYPEDGLSDITLKFMLDRAFAEGLMLHEYGEDMDSEEGRKKIIPETEFLKVLRDTYPDIIDVDPDPSIDTHAKQFSKGVKGVVLDSLGNIVRSQRKIYVAENDIKTSMKPLVHETVDQKVQDGDLPLYLQGVEYDVYVH